MKFSLEIGPTADLSTLPALKDIYITMLPGGDYRETAQQAINLVKKGYNPIPHFPARSIESDNQLKEYVDMKLYSKYNCLKKNLFPTYDICVY